MTRTPDPAFTRGAGGGPPDGRGGGPPNAGLVLAGDQWAYLAGIIAILIGAALVFTRFPRHAEERDLLAEYQREDAGLASVDPIPAPATDQPSDASKGLAHGR